MISESALRAEIARRRFTPEQEVQFRASIEAIHNSTGCWFETAGKIYGKDRSQGVFTPRMNYLQAKGQAVMDKMQEMNLPLRIMGLKPRQKGSTTFFSACVYTFLRRRTASAVLIGGQYSQVKEAWGMMQTYQKHDGFSFWGNQGAINTKDGAWSHGSKLIGETAKDVLAGVGGTHQVLHGFEVARWAKHGVANSAEVLANITKAVPLLPDTMIILESTAEGSSGDFFDRYVRAIDAEDFLEGKITPQPGDYVRVFAPWFEFSDSAMRLTEEQKEEIRTTLDADPEYQGERDLIDVYGRYDDEKVLRLGTAITDFDVWEQLAWRRYAIAEECKRSKEIFNRDYPHSWRTAFQNSGSQRFNTSGLEKIRRNRGRVTPQNGIVEIAKQRVTFRPTTEGEATVTVFEKPVPGCRYILAVDPMTGETQVGGLDPDQHGVFVLRAGYWNSSGQWVRASTAARIVPCRWDIDILAEHVWRLAKYYGGTSGCKIVIEMNQDKGCTELLKLRGADLYQREFFNQREHRLSKALGYQTNEKTRETLVEKLAEAIREWDRPDNGLDIWCPIALEQCENFVRKAKGRSEHADGWHDDDVLAIALGITLIGHATTYTPVANIFNLPPDLRDAARGTQGAGRSMYS